jgi:hypothetical protein
MSRWNINGVHLLVILTIVVQYNIFVIGDNFINIIINY